MIFGKKSKKQKQCKRLKELLDTERTLLRMQKDLQFMMREHPMKWHDYAWVKSNLQLESIRGQIRQTEHTLCSSDKEK